MIIKVCREDGYDYFECDSLKLNAIEWGNRKVLNHDVNWILKPNILRSESYFETCKTTVGINGTGTYIANGKEVPYMLKLVEFKKGEKQFVLATDVTTYLMNDEGKTIDRIN